MCPPAAPEQEHSWSGYRGQTQFVASTPSEEADKGETKAGEAELRLERAIRPAYEARGHSTEKDVVDKVYEVEKTNREQHVVGQQALADDRAASRRRMASNCDRSREQTDHEEFETELTKHEADDRVHRSPHLTTPILPGNGPLPLPSG